MDRWGPGYLKLWARLSLNNCLAFYVLAPTMLANVVYRLAGAKVSASCSRTKPGYWVGLPEMVEIQDGVFSGDGCLFGYPAISRGRILVGPCTIKRGCMIGNLAVLPCNSVLEENSMVGAGRT